jgi:hypothetical protein
LRLSLAHSWSCSLPSAIARSAQERGASRTCVTAFLALAHQHLPICAGRRKPLRSLV